MSLRHPVKGREVRKERDMSISTCVILILIAILRTSYDDRMGADPGPFSMLSIKFDTSEKNGSSSVDYGRKGKRCLRMQATFSLLYRSPFGHTHFGIERPLMMCKKS
jgi:hypothetical protein